MKTIVYIHGFNSAPNTDTLESIKASFGSTCNVVPFSYNYIDPRLAFVELMNQTMDLLPTCDSDIIFVGTSLGGFWAEFLASTYNLPCVLINPAVRPSESLLQFVGDNLNYKTGKTETVTESFCRKYVSYEDDFFRPCHRTVILGMEDDIIDPKIALAHFKDHARIVEVADMGHRVSKPEIIINIISETINTFYHENI